MGEDKNIIFGPCEIYIQDPDGQGWSPIGEIGAQLPELEPTLDLGPDQANTWTHVAEAFDSAAQACTVALETFSEFTRILSESTRAYIWVKIFHPEWVKIIKRTKKKRTRKKYVKRILRAYREANL